MKKKILYQAIIGTYFCFCSLYSVGQIGGNSTFALLDMPFSARSIGLGTDFITVRDQDLNLTISNPALYNSKMHKQVGFNHGFLASGINFGMVNYGRQFNDQITGGMSLRYVSYGKMTRRDEAGNEMGTFSPGEFILGAGMSKQLNPQIAVGVNVNLLMSQLESYSSFGASIDLAAVYELEKANLLITAVAKNVGYQFKSFVQDSRAELPADFQLGIAHKLKHAPFRFSILMHHLNKWDLTYNDPTAKPRIDPLTGDTIPVPVAGFGEKLARHFTFQTEVLISKNIHFRVAFDYHKRQEMKVVARPGLSGFSFGLGMYFKRFSLDYGFLIHSVAGYTNGFTLTTDLDKWKR